MGQRMNIYDDDDAAYFRSEERAPVAIEATFRKSGKTSYQIILTDFSRTGSRVKSLSRTHVGDRIWLTLPGFQAIEGSIRWTNRHGFGVQWDATIHHAVFEHIREKYPDLSADPGLQ